MEPPAGRVPKGLFCYRVDSQSSLLGGALTEGGGLYNWCRSTFNLPEGSRLQKALREMEPDSHGLNVLPFWSGERAPGWAGQARGSIAGLSLASEPIQILRAAMEAVALRIAAVHRLLSPHLTPDHILIASGGALTNSSVWLEIMADALGRPVEVPDLEEASARGAALLALRALGRLNDLSQTIPPPLLVQEPDPERHRLYQRAAKKQEDLYRRLINPSG
jgi:gluconokinase